MNTHAPQKLHGLDHLRALAILLVFLSHFMILTGRNPTWMLDLADFGWTGVDLFFVLSGFLISGQLFEQVQQNQAIRFKPFFLKRFFRIMPAFWVTLLIYFCFPFFREKESLPPLWKFLSFTQNLGLDLRYNRTFSHAWSLCVEEHFYLFLPLVLIFLQKFRLIKNAYWLLALLFLLGFITRMYSFNHFYLPLSETEFSWPHWYKYVYYPTYNRLDGLLIGVGIAAIYHFRPAFRNRVLQYPYLFLVTGLALLTAAFFLTEEQMSFSASVFGFPLVSLGYGCLVVAALSPAGFLYRRRSALTATIATLSYSIYLTHKGIIHLTKQAASNWNLDSNLLLVMCMLTCTGFAFLLYRLVERPFMQLRKRLVN